MNLLLLMNPTKSPQNSDNTSLPFASKIFVLHFLMLVRNFISLIVLIDAPESKIQTMKLLLCILLFS